MVAHPTRQPTGGAAPLSSPTVTDGMYYEFHIPLGVYNAIIKLLAQQVDSPNSPNPIVDASVGREWFSQPRPATQGNIPKPTFFYATGTAYMFDVFGQGIFQIGGGGQIAVPGLDGDVWMWDGAPTNDPFYKMLDSDLWNSRKIFFADAGFPMQNSLKEGVALLIKEINDTPGAFALGGYSQGAAVASLVYREIQSGSLQHRKADLIAGVTFGNPSRQTGHLWPGANPVGSWDQPSNYNTHGCFPTSQRLTNTESFWWDFANTDEIITSVADSTLGIDWVALAATFINDFNGVDLAAFLAAHISRLPWDVLSEVLNALNSIVGGVGAGGHVTYPTAPPPGNPQNGLTSYQIALQYLRDVGTRYKQSRVFQQKTEVLQVNFKLPMPINDLAFQAVQVPADINVWYQDRQDNWRAMLDENRDPITLSLPPASSETWYNFHAWTAPTVAKAVQFRLTRTPDAAMGTRPYCVGLRNVLIRRNIYDRPSGIRATTVTEDALGNVVSTYIRDWDAPKAIDNNPATFWRCEAQPSPDAVVYLILDVRNADGSAQLIDTLYLDPVYTGNALNIYYTNDEPEGTTLAPSPISVAPTTESNTRWMAGRGLWDVSTGSDTSEFTGPFSVGPLVKQNCWMGVEWTPDFTATSPPQQNPVLLEFIPPGGKAEPGQFWPRLYYDVGSLGYGKIVLEFTNGTAHKLYEAPLSPPLEQGEPLRIVAGWSYDDPGAAVYIKVMSKSSVLAEVTTATVNLPSLVTLDGEVSFSKFRGQFTSHVFKKENWAKNADIFLANPIAYVDPDPITPDSQGKVGTSTLTNSLFSCDWTAQRYPVGGMSTSIHVDRRWTPIWRDYTVQRGKLFFPRQISCKYIKLEFSKLTPEPYPVYDTNIKVTMETYPVEVLMSTTTTTTTTTKTAGTTTQTISVPTSTQVHTPGLIEQTGSAIINGIESIGAGITGAVNGLLGNIGNMIGGIAAVNWLDPMSVNAALTTSYDSTVQAVNSIVGVGSTAAAIPNSLSSALGQSTGAMASGSIALRNEATSSLVARRGTVDAQTLAGQAVNNIIGAMPNQGIGASVSNVVENAVLSDFSPTLKSPSGTAVAPAQGTDFWLFPGGLLKMPSNIMEALLGSTQTVTGSTTATVNVPTVVTSTSTSTPTTERLRFNTTETHIYRQLVVTRDAAIGYFAGLREVAAYSTTYIDYEDPLSFDFKVYDLKQWVPTNIKQLTSGAVTTNGSPFIEADLDFATNIDAWTATGDWAWDGTQDNYSGNRVASATVTANGTDLSLVSKTPFSVEYNDEIVIKASVKHVGAISSGEGEIVLDLITYSNGEETGTVSLTPVPSNIAGEVASKVSLTHPTGKTEGATFEHLLGTYTVEADIDALAVRVRINDAVAGGQFWIAEIAAEPRNGGRAYLYNKFTTFSTFTKVICELRDHSLRRSDGMWARTDPLNTNVDSGTLAWYTSPTTMPPGMWGDQFAKWADENVKWGNARATVAIWIDPERTYKGNRSLHFRRAAGAGSAGVRVVQRSNYLPGGLCRIGCTVYKPIQNSNFITLRLRRISDGVYVHEEEIQDVPVGQWYTFTSKFFSLPDTLDQVYLAEIDLTGSFEDELYVSDLYTEVAQIRYLMRLGGLDNPGAINLDVTELAHTEGEAIVSCTDPTNEVSLEVVFLSPNAVAYGTTLTPVYQQ